MEVDFYNKEFRNKIRHLDRESLTALMASSMSDVDVKVFTNTKDIFYFVIPDSNALGTGDLSNIQAAATVSSAGTHTSLSSLGCYTSTLTSLSSLGSASSVACK